MRRPVYVLGLVLAAAGGYFLRGAGSPAWPSHAEAPPRPATTDTPAGTTTIRQEALGSIEMPEALPAVSAALKLPPAELAKLLCRKWDRYSEESSTMFSTSMAEMRSILSSMTGVELTALMEVLEHPEKDLPQGYVSLSIRQAVLEQWGRLDPQAALAWISAIPPLPPNGENTADNPDENGIKGLIEVWMRSDLPAARAAMQNLRPDLKSIARFGFYEEYGRMDPKAALAELNGPADGGLAGLVFSSWLKADATAAAAAMSELKLPPEQMKEVYGSVAKSLAQSDQEKAFAWLETLPADARSTAASSIFSTMAELEPQKAASAILTFCRTPDTAQEFSGNLTRIATIWCRKDPPEEVIAWAGNIPAGNGRTLVIQNIAEEWAAKDAFAASGWIATLPQGEERDAAATQLIENISKEDPASALQWAGSLQDPAKRTEWQSKAFAAWFVREPAAAWQEFNTRSPTEQAEISKSLKGG